MQLIADLHIHSKYSRAVSQQMVVPEIASWAVKKGIGLVGSGDWTHPMWLRELKENLEEAREGIYKLKSKIPNGKVFFMLSTEISSIYTQGGKLRRVHTLILAPGFETVEKINTALRMRGVNLFSDGRPIVGFSVQDLAEMILEIDKRCLIIPAHVWTPWFSLYGSQSGFDSLKECFGQVSENIYGIETGLSSDPAMNWRIPELDNKTIMSFSDAHSPIKLGREATVFQNPNSNNIPNFDDIAGAIKREPGSLWQIGYTIEFYPEEGKYHWTGHRNCNVSQSPQETKKLGETCPVCGRRLTVGVMHRVQELAGREGKVIKTKTKAGVDLISGEEKRPPYVMMVPLVEILTEAFGSRSINRKVLAEYDNLVRNMGSEFGVLLGGSIEEIARVSGEKVAEGIRKVRGGEIVVKPGFDGVFGVVKIWGEEKTEEKSQMSLF